MSSEQSRTGEHQAMAGRGSEVEVVELARLDRRFAALRLPSPTDLSRLRASVEREGVRNPVVASTAVEAGRLVLLDGSSG